jgi:hypothetical protein
LPNYLALNLAVYLAYFAAPNRGYESEGATRRNSVVSTNGKRPVTPLANGKQDVTLHEIERLTMADF